jgi:hypothetical protein
MAVNFQPKSFQFWGAITATPNDFQLDAGLYGIALAAGGFTTATLNKLLSDTTTFVPVSAALTPNSYTILQLPAGQYRLIVVGSALTGEISLVARGGGG